METLLVCGMPTLVYEESVLAVIGTGAAVVVWAPLVLVGCGAGDAVAEGEGAGAGLADTGCVPCAAKDDATNAAETMPVPTNTDAILRITCPTFTLLT